MEKIVQMKVNPQVNHDSLIKSAQLLKHKMILNSIGLNHNIRNMNKQMRFLESEEKERCLNFILQKY